MRFILLFSQGPPNGGTCVRLDRTVPMPAKPWFAQCNLKRCTVTEDQGQSTWFRWELEGALKDVKDFGLQPEKKQ